MFSNRISRSLLFIVIALCFCSCMNNTSDSLIGTHYNISKANDFGFPKLETKHSKEWCISTTNQITYTASDDEVAIGTNVISTDNNEVNAPGRLGFSLSIGETHSDDYTISFDYYVTDDGSISFVMFDESNITYADDYLGNQYYWYRISPTGELFYETTFGKGDKSVSCDGSRVKIEDYSTGVWNAIQLEVKDDKIDLYMNDKFIASFDNIDETKDGCFAIDATTQLLIKDIRFE